MQRKAKAVASILVLLVFPACADPAGPVLEETPGQAQEQLLADNALYPNALYPNALYPNALYPNALYPNALYPNALYPNAYTALVDSGDAGTTSRLLVRYVVSCALTTTQTFIFTWTDAAGLTHDETYQGMMGLAPEWSSGPLATAHQQIVSACVAARTNYYGVQRRISLRSPQAPLATPSAAERGAFPLVEGAFWGNIFDPTSPYLHACYNSPNNANSRAWQRDCVAGHPDGSGGTMPCNNITVVGACSTICAPLNSTYQYYPSCTDPTTGLQTQVITTALPPIGVTGSAGDLQVQVSAPSSVTIGACTPVNYTVTVTNIGTVAASSPVVVHNLPPGLMFVSATTAGGSCTGAGNTVTCTLSSLAVAGVATVTVVTNPITSSDSVLATSFAAASMVESTMVNNTMTATTALVAPTPATWEVAAGNFNGTPIAKGNVVWITGVVKPGNFGAGTSSSVWVQAGTVTLTSGATTYTVTMPAGKTTFSSSVTVASTTFDPIAHQWVTLVPRVKNVPFLATAVPFIAPADLPGGLSASWSGHWITNDASLPINWSWAASVYTSFSKDYNAILVVPGDDSASNPYGNSDKAGTPEAFKPFVIGGARGGGGSNYTGSRVSWVPGTPELQACP
jgi:uncharacterized repeat protein (TIGR01451 family)